VRDILLLDRDDLYAEAQEMKQCEAADGITRKLLLHWLNIFAKRLGLQGDF